MFHRKAFGLIALTAIFLLPTIAQAWTTGFTFSQQSPDPAPGGEVTVGGRVEGTRNCIVDRKIRIQRGPVDAYDWNTITAVRTDSDGKYSRTVVAHSTKDYRAVTVAVPRCGKQESRAITIHVE